MKCPICKQTKLFAVCTDCYHTQFKEERATVALAIGSLVGAIFTNIAPEDVKEWILAREKQ